VCETILLKKLKQNGSHNINEETDGKSHGSRQEDGLGQ
jgi:hypothetical protein